MALEKYNQALEIQTKIGDKQGIAGTLHNIGVIHEQKGEYQMALEKYNQALEILTDIEDKKEIAKILDKINIIHASMKKNIKQH